MESIENFMVKVTHGGGFALKKISMTERTVDILLGRVYNSDVKVQFVCYMFNNEKEVMESFDIMGCRFGKILVGEFPNLTKKVVTVEGTEAFLRYGRISVMDWRQQFKRTEKYRHERYGIFISPCGLLANPYVRGSDGEAEFNGPHLDNMYGHKNMGKISWLFGSRTFEEREVVMRDDPSILGFNRQIPKSVWLFMKIIMVTRMAIMRRMGTFQFSTTRSQYAMFEMQLENGLD